MINLTGMGNKIAETPLFAAVGYGFTHVFTTLNPAAGATFAAGYSLARIAFDPLFKSHYESGMEIDPFTKSTTCAKVMGEVCQIAFGYFAANNLTPIASYALNAFSAEVLTAASIFGQSLVLTLPAAIITLVAVGAGIVYMNKEAVSKLVGEIHEKLVDFKDEIKYRSENLYGYFFSEEHFTD
jgi:hypothetical protein